jgi:hypothetical protein
MVLMNHPMLDTSGLDYMDFLLRSQITRDINVCFEIAKDLFMLTIVTDIS